MLQRLIPIALMVPLLVAGCREDPPAPRPPGTPDGLVQRPVEIPFRHDGRLQFMREDGSPIVEIDIEVAATDSARTRGLMQRTSLPERSGMLFLMPRTDRHSFWMANTPLSLDIMFIAPDSHIVNIAKYTRPYSQQAVVAEAPSRFVVETQAGFADTYGIVPGDRIDWQIGTQEAPTP
jgi:uncharacterized protein